MLAWFFDGWFQTDGAPFPKRTNGKIKALVWSQVIFSPLGICGTSNEQHLDMYVKITQSSFSSLTWCHCCLGQPLPAEMTLAQLLTLLYDRKLPQGYRSIDLTVKLGSKVISDPSLSKTDSFKRLHTEKGECSYFFGIFILKCFSLGQKWFWFSC